MTAVLSYVSASPDGTPKLLLRTPGWDRSEGRRFVQVDNASPVALDNEGRAGAEVTLELDGIAPGHHTARAFVTSVDGSRMLAESSLRFEVTAAPRKKLQSPAQSSGSQAEPERPPGATSHPPPLQRHPWPIPAEHSDPPLSATSRSSSPRPPSSADATAPFIVDPEYLVGSSLLPTVVHAGTRHALRDTPIVAMHAALLRCRTKPHTTLLTTRVTNERTVAMGEPSSSEINFALLPDLAANLTRTPAEGSDSYLQPITSSEPLPVHASPSSQVKSGPEDARLVQVGQRAFLLFNDVLPSATKRSSSGFSGSSASTAAGRRSWRMRRGMFLSELVWPCSVTDSDGRPPRPVALRPLALQAERRIAESDGWQGDVQKNWVPWEYNGSLMLSYSLDPHYVVRVSLPPAPDAAAATMSQGETVSSSTSSQPSALEAVLVHATRFTASTRDGSKRPPGDQRRLIMRGGTPAVRIGGQFVGFMHTVGRMSAAQRVALRRPHGRPLPASRSV